MDPASTAVTIFGAVLDCFERIQLARSFGEDLSVCALKLSILQTRLRRWGHISGIASTQPGEASRQRRIVAAASSVEDDDDGASPLEANVVGLLEEIQDLLDKAQEDSAKMRKRERMATASTDGGGGGGGDEMMEVEKDLPDRMKRLRIRVLDSVKRSSVAATNVARGAKWAFYKKEHFEAFVGQIAGLMDELEKLSPAQDREKLLQVAKEGCRDISSTNLGELKEIARDCDPTMAVAAEEAVAAKSYSYSSTITTNTYGINVHTNAGTISANGFNLSNSSQSLHRWGC